MDDKEKPIIERRHEDEDLDIQDDKLEITRDEADEHMEAKDKEWAGPKKEEFHTQGGGEDPPPGSPEHDRGIISG